MSRIKNIPIKIYQIFRHTFREFRQDDGFNLAAGLSFFAILSTIPLAMIVISFFGHLLGQQDQVFEQIRGWIQTTIPGVQPEFIDFLRQLVDKRMTSGWIGLVILFFVASLLFTNIEHLLDKVFKSSKKRNFLHSRAFSILLLILTSFLFFVPSQLSLLTQHLPATGWLLKVFQFLSGDASYLVGHAVVFFLLLEFIPNQSMPKGKIAIGALFFSGFTVLARQVFGWYMGTALERYHFIYGSLTLLVVLVLWIYYLALLFIFCAELVSVLQELYPQEEK